jgi:aspartate aminotransferase-like enzyme
MIGGAFGGRFHAIAERCGRPADRLDVEWGLPHSTSALHEALSANPGRYDLVTVVHSETSTGVLNPVAEFAEVVAEFDDVLLAVDGVTSVGGTAVDFEETGLDFLLTGSQKALALPPGLAFAVASDRALERAATIPDRGFYFDLVEFDKRAHDFSTTNTPAVSLFYALKCQLERIEAEGLDSRFDRHRRMASRSWEWVAEVAEATGEDFSVLAPEGYRSPTVTTVSLPAGTSGVSIVKDLADQGITIATGYGKLKDAAIRIGHMGDHTEPELDVVLAAVSSVIPATVGGV